MQKSDFYYSLPAELIAQYPLPNRTDSRLLSVNLSTAQFIDDHFKHLPSYLTAKDLLVFNNTQVIPARLWGHKLTGGKVEILIERILNVDSAVAHVRASKAPKIHSEIKLTQGYQCNVLSRQADLFILQFNQPVLQILEKMGHIPLPPYIQRPDNETDTDRYQTIFAEAKGAVAAPTASLHFDHSLLSEIKNAGIATALVTLHVGSGTFQPLRVENLAEHQMHYEYFSVPESTVAAIQQTKINGGRVIAIGTTVARALEAAAYSGNLAAKEGETNLFITPGYSFKVIDGLLTNFHLSESTLLMLVCAFAGYSLTMQAYTHAIEQRYRFFSYGDAMLLMP
ncbi:MAG: hypothetical protein RL637_1063 [Pseudomonadota bacterium]|jgi:S-adenosylmethionine:tRNA ribosyltransferase-isomerase